MKIVGIIAEYNPLHNGHLYHFNKVKEQSNADLVVLSLSSSFTQRGDLSIINKFDKTECALEMGVDLVVECPTILCLSDASRFCYNHVLNLSRCNVDEIWIGSESDDPDIYEKYDRIISSSIFKAIEHKYLCNGYSPKLSFSKALNELKLDELLSNDQLGLFYYQAINKINPNIKLKTIKRINNDYNDSSLNNTLIQSATAIRENIKRSKKYLPKYSYEKLKNYYDEDLLLPFIKHSIIVNPNLENLIESTEGIENRLSMILKAKDMSKAIEILNTKRYSNSKIKRLLINTLFSLTKDELKHSMLSFQFIRVLGFNENGQAYLSKLKKHIKVYTNVKDGLNACLDVELKITKTLDIIFNNNMFKQEQKGPIKK